MRHIFRTAGAVTFGLTCLAALAATAPGEAVLASEIPDSGMASLLPDSVRNAAEVETTSADYSLIPWPAAKEDRAQEDDDSDAANDRAAGSLSELVQRHSASETRDSAQECLAIGVYYESKGEPLDGQLAVARTIINRTRSGKFPASICGVLTQPSQFSFVRGGRLPAPPRGTLQWKQAVAVARIAQDKLWEPRFSNALYFHARHVSPGWRMARLGGIGNHIFYR